MNSRTTHALLLLIAALLALNLSSTLNLLPISRAQATPTILETVRTNQLEIVDGKGQVVAQLHSSEDGGGQLRLRSSSGAVRVKLGSTSDGSGLILMDNESEPAIWQSVGRAGTSVTLIQKGKDKRVLAP